MADHKADIAKAMVQIALERIDRPSFVPTLAFLQRRLRWGWARATLILPYVSDPPASKPPNDRDATIASLRAQATLDSQALTDLREKLERVTVQRDDARGLLEAARRLGFAKGENEL